MLHVHCKITNWSNMEKVAKDFIDNNQARLKVFGRLYMKEYYQHCEQKREKVKCFVLIRQKKLSFPCKGLKRFKPVT